MHASIEQQQGPCSPKHVNGSAATSPLKHSPDSLQNSSSNLSSHRKGKKRERDEQSLEAIKRERSPRLGDGESGQLRSESLLNLEIAKFSEKGGLMDSEAVVRVVRLMQLEKSEKKLDMTGRSMLAGIIAATDKLDCLNHFVQLKGLFVLNEWLQEIHKGKVADSGNLRSSDKSVDDFLLILLRALYKLPVNLNALKMCNIGKSVNHLRSHKNSEIQRRARCLVDTWKKRVEAEMNINETKCGSSHAAPWSGRSQHANSHDGNRHSNESNVAIRSSFTSQSSLKSASTQLMAGESNSKFASAHSGGANSTLSPTATTDIYKDGQSKITANGGSSDPPIVAREEKSSSSSHSHTNSQCSNDQAKNVVPCGNEETKKPTAGPRSLTKTVGSVSKHRKSVNGPSSGDHRETASDRSSSLARNSEVEKLSYNVIDASVQESNNHKFIVKIPNRDRGLAQAFTGESLGASSCRNSRASSPALSEKHDHSGSYLRGYKLQTHHFSEGDGPSSSISLRTCEIKRLSTVSEIPFSPSRNEIKSRKAYDSSFSSMNALIESCAKISEANVPMLAGDDVGMNLLANVATGEMSKSGSVSPAVSPHRNSKVAENHSGNNVGNHKHLPCDDDAIQKCGKSPKVAEADIQHIKEKNDCFRNIAPSDVDNESWQSIDLKDGVNGCDEGDGSPATAPDLGHCKTGDEVEKSTSDVKSILPTKIENKSRKSPDSSLSSMNALIESCVKYSEANAPIAAGDEVGMNLLASVAAGEISKSGAASPAHSLHRSTSMADESCSDFSSRSMPDHNDDQNCPNASVHAETQKQSVPSSASPAHNDDQSDQARMSGKDPSYNLETCSKLDKKNGETGAAVSVSLGATCVGGGEGTEKANESKTGVKDNTNVLTPNRREGSNSSLATKEKLNDVSVKELIRIKHAETTSVYSTEAVDKNDVKVGPKNNALIEQTPAAGAFESTSRNDKPAVPTSIVNTLLPGQLNDLKAEDLDVDCGKLHDQGASQKVEPEKTVSLASPKLEDVFDMGVANKKTKGNQEDLVKKESDSGPASKICSPLPAAQDKEMCSDDKVSILASGEGEETEEGPSVDATSQVAGSFGLDGKLGFDLNEGFDVDDCKDGDPPGMTAPRCISSVHVVSPLPFHSAASASNGLPASITVACAAKGPFVPPQDLLRSKGELKWKGSAATSAFRPAEPRKIPEVPSNTNNAPAPDVSSGKQGRAVFDIDLNVADDLVMEETSCQNMELQSGKRDECSANNGPTGSASGRCAGGLDLDLNIVDEASDVWQPPPQGLRFDSPLQQAKFSSPSTLSNNNSGRRDFDLNNGPAADEVAVELSAFNQHGRMNIPAEPSVSFRINNAELVNLNSWYPAGSSTFSAIPISASLPDREQPYPVVGTGGVPARMLGGPTGTMPFNPDMYRGSVLSSSPAVPFSAAPFQYPVFPFGSSFPLPSSSLSSGSAAFVDPSSGGRLCIPAVPSQLVGSALNVSTHYPRPYFVSLSDVSSSVAGETAQKWGRQGLDLNAGPAASDAEGRDETWAIPPRQVPNIGSLPLADEQSRVLYPVAGGVLKRKEPDGGWDSDRLSYNQHTWQ